jgi:hypothetical protein
MKETRTFKTYYVKVGGVGDGSARAPFGTVAEAITAAQPGDTIEVNSGKYRSGRTPNQQRTTQRRHG